MCCDISQARSRGYGWRGREQLRAHVMGDGGVGAEMVPGGVAEAKIVSRRARPLLLVVGGGATVL